MSHHKTRPSVEAEKTSVQVLLGIQRTWIAGCLKDEDGRIVTSVSQAKDREVGRF